MSKTYPESDYQSQCAPYVLAIRTMLNRWFEAMEEAERPTGQPIPWLPDPLGVWVSEEIAQQIVNDINDFSWEREKNWMAHCGPDRGGPYDAGPGFERLSYPQRVAMIQEWSAIKAEHAAEEKGRTEGEKKRHRDSADFLRDAIRNAMEDELV